MREDEFSVNVALLPYGSVVRGDEIHDCMSDLNDRHSIKRLLDIVSGLSLDAMRGYRSARQSYMPISVAILYHGGMAIASPKRFESFEDKMSFYNCLSTLSQDISEEVDDKPVLISVSSEVWSCSLRKSRYADIAKIARSLGLDPEHKDVKNGIVKHMVDRYGSIGDIPDDHPYIKKFDFMLCLSGFLTIDGPKYVVKFEQISESNMDDVDEASIPCCNSYHFEDYLTGNIKLDVSEYDHVKYDQEIFR